MILKRIISLLLVFILISSLTAVCIFADEEDSAGEEGAVVDFPDCPGPTALVPVVKSESDLAIAREIVDGLGEKLWVQSAEGQGTIFFITVTTK